MLFTLSHRAGTRCRRREAYNPCLFGLAPCGVYLAASITGRAVRSYRTFSPLPSPLARGGRYVLCCTCRPAALKRPSRTLSGTLPCGVRTFLPRPTPCGADGSDHPAACKVECTADGPFFSGELTATCFRIRSCRARLWRSWLEERRNTGVSPLPLRLRSGPGGDDVRSGRMWLVQMTCGLRRQARSR
jgi:hypothetical protein